VAETRPYHHGNLRDALLDAAERRLEDGDVAQLSMRELARSVGVSHAAPRAHFADRRALVVALAQRGFERLAVALREANAAAGTDFDARFRATMAAFVAFAGAHGALLEIMFPLKRAGGPDSPLRDAAAHALGVISDLIDEGIATGRLAPIEPARYWFVLAALTRGMGGLVAAGAVAGEQLEVLIADAARTFLAGSGPAG
jgi:AcrR family transcriptional regulator